MAFGYDNRHMKELTLSSRCVFNTQFIDSDTKEVVYSTRTPKVWFTRQSVTTVARHEPSRNHHSGSTHSSPVIPQPASPTLLEKVDTEDFSSESTAIDHHAHHTLDGEHELKKERGNEVEVTKIQWKFFHNTLFEHDFQTKDVNEIMEKTGRRPFRFDRTFKANGVSYKWDLGAVGFDSPTLKRNDSGETVVAKFHRPCPFSSTKATLELRPGSEDILDMIVMTLVWVEWRQKLRIAAVIPTAALLL